METKRGHGAVLGHFFALVVIVVWGITFVSTKVLLQEYTPIEVLFFRFVLGYVALWVIRPRLVKLNKPKDEILFIVAGATGVAAYFLMENIALTFTTASNVGLIVATAPLFTALFIWVIKKVRERRSSVSVREESSDSRLGVFRTVRFLIGFVLAMTGIALASLTGDATAFLAISPLANTLGCLLALGAALVWAVYNIFSKTISNEGYDIILATRRIFFWGLIFMLPALFVLGFSPDWSAMARPEISGNILFLGLIASALCYVMWNTAISILGSVKTVIYLYLVPVVDLITSVIVLGEPLTPLIVGGMALVIFGLLISERS